MTDVPFLRVAVDRPATGSLSSPPPLEGRAPARSARPTQRVISKLASTGPAPGSANFRFAILWYPDAGRRSPVAAAALQATGSLVFATSQYDAIATGPAPAR
jgi:hypothetical protein